MAITRPCYTTREEVRAAPDITWAVRANLRIDRAIQDASERVEGQLHRVFYPELRTVYADWPNFQSTYPWKVYLDAAELADVTGTVPVVTTGGNSPVTIPAENILWCPANYGPPYEWLELDRSTSSSFGLGDTPQRDIHILGVTGYWAKTTGAGQLAAAVTDTTGTAITVTDSAAAGVGDLLLIDTERMLLTEKRMVATGQSQVSGLATAKNNDESLGVADGTAFSLYETLLLDSERVLVVDIAGDILTVERAYDGTTLAAHTDAVIYAPRQWTVARGASGTTAATHDDGTAVSMSVYPGIVKDYALAEALVQLKNEPGAFAMSQGSGPSKQGNIGGNLPDLRDQAYTAFGRKARQRTV